MIIYDTQQNKVAFNGEDFAKEDILQKLYDFHQIDKKEEDIVNLNLSEMLIFGDWELRIKNDN